MSYTMDFSLNLGPAYAGKTDLRAQLVDTTGAAGTPITTGFVEIGTGRGLYLWHYTLFPDDHRGGVRFYSNAASSVILAFIAVNPEDGEYGIKPSTLVANFWAYLPNRTLTTPAASGSVALDGTDLNITISATYAATVTGLTISASWTKVYFTIKEDLTDTDAEAKLQIKVTNPGTGTDGLIRLNGLTTTAANGSLAVTQASGTIAILIADDATVSLEENKPYYYDIKQLTSDGKSVILTSGVCNALSAVTLAIS